MIIQDKQSPYEKSLNKHFRFKKFFKNIPFSETLFRLFNPHYHVYVKPPENEDDALKVMLDIPGLKDKRIAVGKDTDLFSYYTKFIRFCKYNGLDYDVIDMHKSNVIKTASQYDYLLWRPMGAQWAVTEALSKIKAIIDSGTKVFPLMRDLMLYENKNMQYYMMKNAGLPGAETFISYDYLETLDFITNSPERIFISKVKAGSASHGVIKLNNKKQALRFVNKVFRLGIRYNWHSDRQKG